MKQTQPAVSKGPGEAIERRIDPAAALARLRLGSIKRSSVFAPVGADGAD